MKWLVEISLKDWIYTPEGVSRVVAYVEIDAFSKLGAQVEGFEQFKDDYKYKSSTRKALADLGAGLGDVCAPDAVEIG